jgi:poly(3-hydroxybutyrate) depolymerase
MMELKPRPCDAPWRFYEAPPVTACRQIIDGWLRTWDEYVPASYDGSQAVPLVLSVHGAAHHSADRYTAWQLIADRENFIVAYPHSLIEEIKFNVWEHFTAEDGMPDDVEYFDKLIDILLEKYNIDPTRIYIQGQSVGDNMASTYLYAHGDRIAAAAPLSGPPSCSTFYQHGSDEPVIYPHHAVPVLRRHGSEDTQQPLGTLGKICIMSAKGEEPTLDFSETARRNKWLVAQKPSLDLWVDVNGCKELPKLGLKDRYNWLVYEGDCRTCFYVVEGGEHGPTLDMADRIWTNFFSRYRRVDGKIIETEDNGSEWDCGAIALADGASVAYVDNKLVSLDDAGRAAIVVNGEFYVPAAFLAKAFPDTTVEVYADGQAIHVHHGSDYLQMAMGNRSVVWNDTLVDMPTTLYQNDSLYVPIAWVAKLMLGMQEAKSYGTCYLNYAGGKLSYDMTYVIRELLGTEPKMTPQDILALEDSLRAIGGKQYSAHNIGDSKYPGGPEEIFQLLKGKYQKQYEEYLSEQK